MAKRPSISSVGSGYTSPETLNQNFQNIAEAFDNTLSRDGSSPDQMESDLDMNSNDILNAKDVKVAGTLSVAGVDINDLLQGVGPGTVFNTTNRFSGTGSQTTFTLTKDPISRSNTMVYIDGIYQQKDTYFLSGNDLVFSEAPPTGVDNIEVNIQESTETGVLEADVNLGVSSSPTETTITNTGGGNATIPSATPASSGVMSASDKTKLDGVEAGAEVNPTDEEIETAYNGRVSQVSPSERTAGTSTDIRRFTPADIAAMASIHGGGGGGSSEIRFNSRSSAVAATVDPSVDAIDVLTSNGLLLSYQRDPSGTALSTNGGSVNWSPVGAVFPDHWEDNVSPGVTNMTTAFASAYSYVGDGGTVFLPAENYLINGINSTTGTSLVGPGAKLTLANNADSNVIKYTSTTTPVLIYGIEVDGNKLNQTVSDSNTIGIYLFESDNIEIDSCYVHGCAYDGIRIQGNSGTGSGEENTVTNNTCNDNGIDATNRRAPGIRPFNTRGCIVSNNVCNRNTTDGIDIDAFSYNLTCTSNRCEQNRRYGIFVEEGSKRVVVSSNVIRLTGDQSLWVGNATGTGINVNNEVPTGASNAIEDIIISSNVVETSNQAAIRVAANQPNTFVYRVSIVGNMCNGNDVLGTATAGINIRANATGTVDNVLVVSNVSFGNSAYGLSIGSDRVTDVAIGGNDFRGNGTSEMINSGSTSVRFLPESTMESTYSGRVGRSDMLFEHTGSNDLNMTLSSDTGAVGYRLRRTSGAGYEMVNDAGVWKLNRGTSGTTSGDTVINVNGDRALFNLPVRLPSYTVATAPSPAGLSGATIYVSNGASGSPVLAFSDGGQWLRCDTRGTISA